MPVAGANIVSGNIVAYGGRFLATVNKVMKEVKKDLDNEITKNISLTDHSLKDLADLGHPYRTGGDGLHSPNWQVHKQSGKLLSSKYSGTVDASINGRTLTASAFVGLDDSKAPHALNVVFGTSKMIPRPVLVRSRDKIADAQVKKIQSTLKDITVSFK